MRNYEVFDDFGRRTVFEGVKLVAESTDTEDARKPQWVEVVVWRTTGGSFIVQRTTHYRVRHTSDRCGRAEGYDLVPATPLDTYPCVSCNKAGLLEGGLAQSTRISVDVYKTPAELIESFRVEGRYSNLARTVLADIAEQDVEFDQAWNTVVVP